MRKWSTSALFSCLVYQVLDIFVQAAESSSSPCGVRSRRRTFGIDDYNLFTHGISSESAESFEMLESHLDSPTADDDEWSGGGSGSDPAFYYVGSHSSSKGAHQTDSFAKGSLKDDHSGSRPLGDSRSKLPKGGSNKSTKSKGSKKSKQPHVARKKVHSPKGSSASKKSSIEHKEVILPTFSPAPSLRPATGDMPTINVPSSTAAPTVSTASASTISLAPYAILYSLDLTRIPLDDEVNQVVSITENYLARRFEVAYPTLQELKTNLDAQRLVAPDQPFVMNYTSVASIPETNAPTEAELTTFLSQAFTQEGKAAYILLLQQQLAESNIFVTTNDIAFRLQTSADDVNTDTPGDESTAGVNEATGSGATAARVVTGAASATAVVAMLIFGAGIYISRKERRPGEDEHQKIQRVLGCGTSVSHETIAETAAGTTVCMDSRYIRQVPESYINHVEADDATEWTMQTMQAMSIIVDEDTFSLTSSGQDLERPPEMSSGKAWAVDEPSKISDKGEASRRQVPHQGPPEELIPSDMTYAQPNIGKQVVETNNNAETALLSHSHTDAGNSQRVSDLIKMFSR